MELVKPTNITELQQLTNYILEGINDKRKATVKLSSRMWKFHGLAHTPNYITSGRRKITISNHHFETCALKDLINTIIHEIAHFKYSKTQKLRRIHLKRGTIYGFDTYKLRHKHAHTKAFKRLVEKLETKFSNYHKNNNK